MKIGIAGSTDEIEEDMVPVPLLSQNDDAIAGSGAHEGDMRNRDLRDRSEDPARGGAPGVALPAGRQHQPAARPR